MISKLQGYDNSNYQNLLCDSSGRLIIIIRAQGYDYNGEAYHDLSVNSDGELQSS